jgi:hypothetical protein
MQVDHLDTYRLQGDAPADRLVEEMMHAHQKSELYGILSCHSWEEVGNFEFTNSALRDFLLTDNKLPEWADEHQMKKATALFRSNGNEFLFMLGIVSLPYCYAAAKGALSLFYTEKIRKNTEARLLETTAFVVEIMKPDAFDEAGSGFLAVKLVRLRHAVARYYLKCIPAIRAMHETPVNQEDMAGTNLAFSYMAIRAMPKIGVQIPMILANSYMHFWAVVSHLMGIEAELLPRNMKEAQDLEKRIAARQFYPSKEGEELTMQLLEHYRTNIPNKATVQLIKPLIIYMLGDEIASIIGLMDKTNLWPVHRLMRLLPLFKRFVFPPVQSFETIIDQIENRQRALPKAS